MQRCCIKGCESHKNNSKKKNIYFKLPVDNKPLLKKWLAQIRIPNWYPTENDEICSSHFQLHDINFKLRPPKLKRNAVPTIFPLKHFQSFYVDELQHNSNKEEAKSDNNSTMKTMFNQPIGNYKGQPSVVLLCTPMKTAGNVSNVNSLTSSNISMKKIPLRDGLVKSDNSNQPELINPYLLIVSQNEEKKVPKKEIPEIKKKILRLRIEIERKYTEKDLAKELSLKLKAKSKVNSLQENNTEVVVDDKLSSKVIVYKLDPLTGKITVTKREKNLVVVTTNIEEEEELVLEKPTEMSNLDPTEENSLDINKIVESKPSDTLETTSTTDNEQSKANNHVGDTNPYSDFSDIDKNCTLSQSFSEINDPNLQPNENMQSSSFEISNSFLNIEFSDPGVHIAPSLIVNKRKSELMSNSNDDELEQSKNSKEPKLY